MNTNNTFSKKAYSFKLYIILGLAICLILVLFKSVFSSAMLKRASFGMPALIERGHIENLYIGSSMFRQGLDIEKLDLENPGQNYILSYNGNSPVFEYIELKNLIDNGLKIDNLYIDMYAYSISEGPDMDDSKLLIELSASDKYKIFKMCRPSVTMPALYTSAEESPLRIFDPFRAVCADASFAFETFVSVNNEQLLTMPINLFAINTQFRNGGSLVHTASMSKEMLDSLKTPSPEIAINSLQSEAINNILDLAKENNIKITFIETPKYESIASNEGYINVMNEYIKLLSDFNVTMVLQDRTYDEFTRVYGIDESLVKTYSFDNSDAAQFGDFAHLSYDGRVNFTSILSTLTEL